jgi:UDP-N-acetylmuramate dehydrogenase
VPTRLAELTTLRLGGAIEQFVEVTEPDELVRVVRAADAAGQPVLLVGGGSNLVAPDAGWPGVAVRVATTGLAASADGAEAVSITVQAGLVWDELVARSVAEGWSGLAAMSGIPGAVGATPIQNVGAYGSEVAETITGLTVLDRRSGAVEAWAPSRCAFGFRTSAFKHTDRYVILDVSFRLARSAASAPVRYAELARLLGVAQDSCAPSAAVRETVLELRRSKGMLLDPNDHDTWSVGSFFVNPFVPAELVPDGCPNWTVDGQVKLSAAWLIESAGFHRGYGLDRPGSHVAVSTKHTLALTNRGGATTAELLALAGEIRAGVEARFGIRLRPEAHLAPGVDF